MAADENGFVRRAGKGCEEIACGVDGVFDVDGGEFAEKPFAGGAPDRAPSEALRAVGSGSESSEFAKIGDDPLGGLDGNCAGKRLRKTHGTTPILGRCLRRS